MDGNFANIVSGDHVKPGGGMAFRVEMVDKAGGVLHQTWGGEGCYSLSQGKKNERHFEEIKIESEK